MRAPEALAAELRRQIAAAQVEQRAPSVAAAVVRDGEVIWSDAVGLADVERGEAATPDHQYRIGSITKSFTAAAIMQLREAGKLDLDDRLDAHLPGVEHGALPIRRLLAHASGLQREIPGDVWETLVFPDGAELVGLMGEAELVLGPGERFHYSNLAFSLLGEVIARLSGMPYEQYVTERIIQPLGLQRTTFERAEPAATPYFVDPYADVVHPEPLIEKSGSVAAAGSLWSTAEDLTGWAAFLADPNEEVLSRVRRCDVVGAGDGGQRPLGLRLRPRAAALARRRPRAGRALRRHARLSLERLRVAQGEDRGGRARELEREHRSRRRSRRSSR